MKNMMQNPEKDKPEVEPIPKTQPLPPQKPEVYPHPETPQPYQPNPETKPSPETPTHPGRETGSF
ncbi:MAG: hypothetical protein Fur0041_15610 [Bacteroidia bacterium]